MTVSLFTFVDFYGRVLSATPHLLRKGQAHAQSIGVTDGFYDVGRGEPGPPLLNLARFLRFTPCSYAPAARVPRGV